MASLSIKTFFFQFFLLFFLAYFPFEGLASENFQASFSQKISKNVSSAEVAQNLKNKLKRFSIRYMSFFDGPGIFNEDLSVSPNAIGKPKDDGLKFNNNLSFRYQLAQDLSFDFQARFHWISNNATKAEGFQPLRWQSPRLGISTTFFKTEHSKLTGAFNTDLPYFFPEPLGGGYIAAQRTTLLTPGFFAKYSWNPRGSRWSVFSLVQPRFYFYQDRNVAEPQYSRAGYSPRLKNELTLNFSPSLNYAFSDKLGYRLGTQFVYQKLIASSWNPFNGTNRTADLDSKAWRLSAIPLQTGLTYKFNQAFELSSYLQAYPFSNQRVDKKGRQATFEETFSAGAWISGRIF